MRPTSCLLAAGLFLGLAAAAPPPACARKHAFGAVVHEVETHYHLRHSNRFLMWMVSKAVGIVHPDGVLSMKLAMFEDRSFAPRPSDAQFQTALDRALEDGWQPLVRSWSRRDVERSYVYAREAGKDVRLFIVCIEARQAVVLDVKVRGAKFSEMIGDPGSMSRLLGFGSPSDNVSAAYRQTGPPVLERRPAASDDSP